MYDPPSSSETAVVPPARPDEAAITTIKSPVTETPVLVLFPAVVVHVDPSDVTVAAIITLQMLYTHWVSKVRFYSDFIITDV